MQQALLVRLLFTLLAVVCAAYAVFLERPGHFPFDWRVQDTHTVILEPQGDGRANRVRSGDRLDLRGQDVAARAALYLTTVPAEAFLLTVQRNGESRRVQVSKQVPADPRPGYLHALHLVLVLALGLATLWWGRDWTAWGLSVFAIAYVVNDFLFLPLPAMAALATTLFNWTVIAPLITLGLYATALALSGDALARPIRIAFHVLLAVLLAMSMGLTDAHLIAFAMFGDTRLLQYNLSGIVFAVAIFVPVGLLLAAYPRATPGRRLRMRWIIVSLALFLGPVAWLNAGGTRGGIVPGVWWATILCGAAGLLYAVLRRRVVAISFAVNRALVFAVIAGLVVGAFALLSAVIESTALGRDAGIALTVGVSLTIGLVLEGLRDRINSAIERLFFRRRYAAEQALRRFARQCAYITSRDSLLDETVKELDEHVRPDALAIYEATHDGYLRVREAGERRLPERVDVDDRAFVHLRAERSELRLADTKSALGPAGYAWPMAVRGFLVGAVICGTRTEAYTKDERSLVAHLAQQVGLALHALHARDSDAFIETFASGAMDVSVARATARRLHSRSARSSHPPADVPSAG